MCVYVFVLFFDGRSKNRVLVFPESRPEIFHIFTAVDDGMLDGGDGGGGDIGEGVGWGALNKQQQKKDSVDFLEAWSKVCVTTVFSFFAMQCIRVTVLCLLLFLAVSELR